MTSEPEVEKVNYAGIDLHRDCEEEVEQQPHWQIAHQNQNYEKF